MQNFGKSLWKVNAERRKNKEKEISWLDESWKLTEETQFADEFHAMTLTSDDEPDSASTSTSPCTSSS